MRDKIINELIDLNLPLNGRYFEYWVEVLLAEYYKIFKTDKITLKYKWLGDRFETTASAAERVLRHGQEFMKNRIAEKYKIKTKITNETIFTLFKFKVFKEE